MSHSEGVRGKPILVIAIEDDGRDYHDIFNAVHKALDEGKGDKGRQIIGAHDYYGVYMLTARAAKK